MDKIDSSELNNHDVIMENLAKQVKTEPLRLDESTGSAPSNSDEPWSYKILLLLKKVGKKTMGYRWMHEQETRHYEKMNTMFGIVEMLILAFLGTITGAGFVNFVADTGVSTNKILYIIITVIQLITVFLAAIVKGYRSVRKYEKYKSDHFYAALKNAELNLSIQYQLSLNVKDRENDIQFLKNVLDRFNDILVLSPTIREYTKKRYLEGSEDNDMFNPIITDGECLQIVIHDTNTNRPKDNILVENQTTDSKMKYEIDRWLKNF